MTGLFLKILDMSVSAGWMILAILGLRPFLRAAPKRGTVLLWGLAGIRLLIPFSLESRFSLIPGIHTADPPPVTTVITLPAGEGETSAIVRPMPIEAILSIIWLVGAAILIAYFAVSYLRLRRRLDTAVLLRDNIYQSELVRDPMVVGMIKPRIYIPFRMDDRSMNHVISHEQTHIRRGDHLWKLLAFVCLSLHWFNPLVWIAYALLCRDIELACDEAVISRLDYEARGDYAQTLMAFSVKGSGFPIRPMGFGTVDAKARIRAIAHYRRPGAGMLLLLAVCGLVLAVCFLTEPVTPDPEMPVGMETPVNVPADLPGEEELWAELEVLKGNLASYKAHLAEDRDRFVYKKTQEKADADDLLGLQLSMTFYRRMIQELEIKIVSVERQLGIL